MTRPRILVTGFSAFPGAPRNPTETLVGALDVRRLATRLDIELAATVLPTEYAAVAQMLPRLWAQVRPDAAIHFGLHGRAGQVRVETRGANYMRPFPDAARRHPDRVAIEPDGPLHRRATLPAARLNAALRAEGIPARLSHDAGGYLCNYATYLSLGLAREGTIAGFVHLPWPAEVRARRAPHERPGWSALALAMETAIAVTAVTVRNRRLSGHAPQ
ncbi:pyroglutamyl-peptidase I [Microbaculum marinum]|uniref:Pyroglutamyl-peptidase I n=1 Tax=Microbaculum marinum TaxID=1764581 RepID=A0AAW9RQX3_9HYPH